MPGKGRPHSCTIVEQRELVRSNALRRVSCFSVPTHSTVSRRRSAPNPTQHERQPGKPLRTAEVNQRVQELSTSYASTLRFHSDKRPDGLHHSAASPRYATLPGARSQRMERTSGKKTSPVGQQPAPAPALHDDAQVYSEPWKPGVGKVLCSPETAHTGSGTSTSGHQAHGGRRGKPVHGVRSLPVDSSDLDALSQKPGPKLNWQQLMSVVRERKHTAAGGRSSKSPSPLPCAPPNTTNTFRVRTSQEYSDYAEPLDTVQLPAPLQMAAATAQKRDVPKRLRLTSAGVAVRRTNDVSTSPSSAVSSSSPSSSSLLSSPVTGTSTGRGGSGGGSSSSSGNGGGASKLMSKMRSRSAVHIRLQNPVQAAAQAKAKKRLTMDATVHCAAASSAENEYCTPLETVPDQAEPGDVPPPSPRPRSVVSTSSSTGTTAAAYRARSRSTLLSQNSAMDLRDAATAAAIPEADGEIFFGDDFQIGSGQRQQQQQQVDTGCGGICCRSALRLEIRLAKGNGAQVLDGVPDSAMLRRHIGMASRLDDLVELMTNSGWCLAKFTKGKASQAKSHKKASSSQPCTDTCLFVRCGCKDDNASDSESRRLSSGRGSMEFSLPEPGDRSDSATAGEGSAKQPGSDNSQRSSTQSPGGTTEKLIKENLTQKEASELMMLLEFFNITVSGERIKRVSIV